MPIQTYATFLRLTKLCGTRVPAKLMSDLVEIRVSTFANLSIMSATQGIIIQQHDDQKVKDYGVKLAIDMVRRLTTEGNVPGVHFCTLNLEKSVQRVLEGLAWTSYSSITSLKITNKLIAVSSNDRAADLQLLTSATLLHRISQARVHQLRPNARNNQSS